MSTKTRQGTTHVPTQRQAPTGGDTPKRTEPAPEHDHRVRNITLLVTTAVIALGAVLVLWFAVFAGGDSQAPTSPNNISQGTDGRPDFLRQQQEQPVDPQGQSNDQQLPDRAR